MVDNENGGGVTVTLSRAGFLALLGLGVGDDLPTANISKTIRCMPMKFSQVDGMVKLNIRKAFVVMATNVTSLLRHRI